MSKKTDPRFSDTRRIKGSGNVFLDLGFDPAEAKIMALRAEVGPVAGLQPGHAADTGCARRPEAGTAAGRVTQILARLDAPALSRWFIRKPLASVTSRTS